MHSNTSGEDTNVRTKNDASSLNEYVRVIKFYSASQLTHASLGSISQKQFELAINTCSVSSRIFLKIIIKLNGDSYDSNMWWVKLYQIKNSIINRLTSK